MDSQKVGVKCPIKAFWYKKIVKSTTEVNYKMNFVVTLNDVSLFI